MTAITLNFAGRYSTNMPFWDEFSLVEAVTRHQPVTLHWLWSQHNEHRIPLPRLVYLGLAVLSGSDFRAGMIFSIFLMSALAALLVLAAKRIRGNYSYTDAFFPAVLLGLGNFENQLWSFQIAFALSTFLICGLLALLVSRTSSPVRFDGTLSFWPVVGAGVCITLLPLCGAQGTILAPPLALWLATAGVRAVRRQGFTNWSALLAVAFSLLACGVIACYFVTGYVSPAHHAAPPSWYAWLRTSLQFLMVGFGPAISESGRYGMAALGLMTALVIGGLSVAWKRRPEEKQGIASLCLFLLGMLALAAAIGKGRAFSGDTAGLASRYTWLSVPFIIGLYLAVGRWGTPSLGRLVQTGLVLLAAMVFVANFREGHAYGETRLHQSRELKAQLRASSLPQDISVEVGSHFFPERTFFLQSMELMREAKIGPYK
jgi:hypothetical protein